MLDLIGNIFAMLFTNQLCQYSANNGSASAAENQRRERSSHSTTGRHNRNEACNRTNVDEAANHRALCVANILLCHIGDPGRGKIVLDFSDPPISVSKLLFHTICCCEQRYLGSIEPVGQKVVDRPLQCILGFKHAHGFANLQFLGVAHHPTSCA